MKSKRSINLAFSELFFAAVCVLGTGCHSTPKPKAWNVVLTKTTPATVRVDLIGVSRTDKSDWTGYNLNEYWKPDDRRRKDADKISFENLELNQRVKVDRKDPQWEKWFSHGVNELLVIADLPGDFSGGADDPRRKFLPLNKKAWDASPKDTLDIEIQQTLIKILTPPKE
ncbi:MAG TPA: hypothetical protein VLT36_10420 [Candidatus Dormibacteraeota bacterium]|nr:hypothetical protein [Candidatus Dormibacteraeota bacterium]